MKDEAADPLTEFLKVNLYGTARWITVSTPFKASAHFVPASISPTFTVSPAVDNCPRERIAPVTW